MRSWDVGYVMLRLLNYDATKATMEVELPALLTKAHGPYRLAIVLTDTTVSTWVDFKNNRLVSVTDSDVDLAPIQFWETGHALTPLTGRVSFNSVFNHVGGFIYNGEQDANDVTFGLGFESRFQANAHTADTEYYYFWNSPDRKTTRRIFQANTSWGNTETGATAHPAGWSRWSFDVNHFGVGNGAGFADNFRIDLDRTPHELRFDGEASIAGSISLGGNLQTRGAGPNVLTGTTEISGGPLAIDRQSNARLEITPIAGDAGILISRTPDGTEQLRIGAAADGSLFGGASNSYVIDLSAPTSERVRSLLVRASAGTPAKFNSFVKFDPRHRTVAIGADADRRELEGIGFFVGGSVNINDGSNVSHLAHDVAKLEAGRVLVAAPRVTAETRIFLTIQTPEGAIGTPYIGSREPGRGFTILSTSNLDQSVVAWLLIEP